MLVADSEVKRVVCHTVGRIWVESFLLQDTGTLHVRHWLTDPQDL